MLKNSVIVICIGLLFSCGNVGKKQVVLNADANGIEEQSKVYLSKLGENNQQIYIDTTEVVNEKFQFDLSSQNKQEINILRIENAPGMFVFVNENQDLQLKVNAEDLRKSKLKGGEHNQLLAQYLGLLQEFQEDAKDAQESMRNAMQSRNQADIAEIRSIQQNIEIDNMDKRKQIIEENPNSVVSLMILSDMMSQKKLNNKEAKDYFNSLTDDVKDLQLGRNIQEQIAKVGATDIGAVAPDFSGPTPEGIKLNLKDAMGKVTLIDFWASWCKPCRVENPNIVDVYQDYKDKGLSIVQVSLDRQNQQKAWTNAIEADNLGDWHHVSNLMFWKDPIAVKYGVRSIPAAFLIDEDGVIIGKNLRGRQLREKVSEYLD